jgi:hypothetical protein
MDDMCRVRDDGKPGCQEPAPTVITGASLGLMLDHDPKGALLVPAWLFAVKGSADTFPWIAVDPAYLVTYDGDADGDGEVGSGSGSSSGSSTGSGSSGSDGGSTDPAPPVVSPGTEPNEGSAATPPDAPAEPATVQSYSLDGEQTLVGYVELKGCDIGELQVKEASNAVYLVASTRPNPNEAAMLCTASHLQALKVGLTSALGDREVRNADGSEVPRRK